MIFLSSYLTLFSEDSIISLVRHQAIDNQELEIVLEAGEESKGNRYWIRINEVHRNNLVELKSLGVEITALEELWPWCHVTDQRNLVAILDKGLAPKMGTVLEGGPFIPFGLHGLPQCFLGKRRTTIGRIVIYPDYRK